MLVFNGGPNVRVAEATLFPFDPHGIPFRYRLQIGLVSATNAYELHRRVLERGEPGTPDHLNVHFYGTVLRVGDELRMWYPGRGDDGGTVGNRMCYAVSQDGIQWQKPNLGLVTFNGSTANNLVSFDSPYNTRMSSILVLYDPDDPMPDRRFKLINEVSPFCNIAAFSPDGLHWKESPHNPVLKHNAIEPGGLMKFNGSYYLNGQGGNVGTKRALVTYVSYDFDHWTDAVAVGLRRDVAPHRQLPGPHAGEQIHLGAGLWNRGNVILGIYGQWHGESNDRAFVTMDLGLVVSNDGLHFVEPIPDFQIITAYEIRMPGDADEIRMEDDPLRLQRLVPAPCLAQGQGFENIGDTTLTWYSPWLGGFICAAQWPRDRLGYFEVVPDPKPRYLAPEDTHSLFWGERVKIGMEKAEPHCISCPIRVDDSASRVFVNADGLSDQSYLTVELLDERFRPLAGWSADDALPLTTSGLREPATWRAGQTLPTFDRPVRVKVRWGGTRLDDAYLYAIYVSNTPA